MFLFILPQYLLQEFQQIMDMSLLKCPGFFTVYIPEFNEKELKIPTGFVQDIKKALPKNVSLKDRYGNSWHVYVKKVGGIWHFKNGWKRFVVESSLNWGDFVIFKYLGGGIFFVKIFGENACEKKLPTNTREKKQASNACETSGAKGPKGRTTEERYKVAQEEDSDEESEDDDPREKKLPTNTREKKQASNAWETSGAKGPKGRTTEERYKVAEEEDGDEESEEDDDQGVQFMNENEGDNNQGEQVAEAVAATTRRRRRKRITDWFDVALFTSGRAPRPDNPYFVTRCNLSRKDEFHIPGQFIRLYTPRLPEQIVLIDGEGRRFTVYRKVWTDGRMYYIRGWRDFCSLNLLGQDDKCICEFIDGEDGGVNVHISIVRVNGQEQG